MMDEAYDRRPRPSKAILANILRHIHEAGYTSIHDVDFTDMDEDQAALILTVLCENKKNAQAGTA